MKAFFLWLWKYLVSSSFVSVLVNIELLCGVATGCGMLLGDCMVGALECLGMVNE